MNIRRWTGKTAKLIYKEVNRMEATIVRTKEVNSSKREGLGCMAIRNIIQKTIKEKGLTEKEIRKSLGDRYGL